MADLPRYQCHKIVRAFKIQSVIRSVGQNMLSPEGEEFDNLVVSNDYLKKHDPQPGGYYVQYEDGYSSYSPAEAFEKGYTRL